MKKIYNVLLIVGTIFAVSSCDDFMEVHKDFIKDGEIIYSPKVDSVSFIAGEHRILFRCWLYNSPNVKSIDLYWNDNTDSLITLVTPTTGRDSFDIMATNLEEKSYTFYVRTTDIFGYKSLWTSDFGTAYGDNYRETLGNRRVNEVTLVENGGIVEGHVTFFSALNLQVHNEIRYVKSDGTTAIVSMLPDQTTGVCRDAKPGSRFETRSLFIPEEEAIDTFATAWVGQEAAFPSIYLYDRSTWEAIAVSDERPSDGGGLGMHAVLDGNHNTWWHSYYGDYSAECPHWLVVDMKRELNAAQIDLWRRPGSGDPKTVELYVGDTSDPNGAWTKISQTIFTADKMVVTPDDKTTRGRYLKLVLPDSNRNPFVNLAEVYLYGGI
jgi:hypothetical protein